MRKILVLGFLVVSGCASQSTAPVGSAAAPKGDSIDREALRQVMKQHVREVRDCYERALKETPELKGKIVISSEIVAGGLADKTKVVSDEMSDKSVGDCIVQNVRRWKFPEPPAGQVVEFQYPYYFSN